MNIPFHVSLVAAALILTAGTAFSAPTAFDLDVRELSPAAPPRTTRPQRTMPKTVPPPVVQDGESTYTVRPGDHLFLILMRHYGLSNNAAERLVPEVMRLNGISNPRGLTPGRRVIIPLATHAQRGGERPARPAPKGGPPRPVTAVDAPEKNPPPPSPAAPQSLEIVGGPSCEVGKSMAEKLGLLVPSSGIIQGFPSFAVRHAGVTVEVACGLSPAEQYTYEQLLSRHHVQLLVFGEMEPNRRVIEKIANRLNLIYRTEEPAGRNRLPLRVYLRPIGETAAETRLTVLVRE